MLVHELFLGNRKCAELVAKGVFILTNDKHVISILQYSN